MNTRIFSLFSLKLSNLKKKKNFIIIFKLSIKLTLYELDLKRKTNKMKRIHSYTLKKKKKIKWRGIVKLKNVKKSKKRNN